MIDYHIAQEIIISTACTLPEEQVALPESTGRILSRDIMQDTDMPPFNKSMMDGYACKRSELGRELEIMDTLYAGKESDIQLDYNQCVRIMTGAVVPVGADCVFKQEDALITAEGKVVCTHPEAGNNINYRGEDLKAGDRVIARSAMIQTRHLPVLAGAGVTHPFVYKKPDVMVFATGTELVEPSAMPLPHQIRNSNTSQLLGQLKELSIVAEYGGILPDQENILMASMSEAFERFQVVLLTGGVSVGDYDLIPAVLADLGFEILITSTAIKPGKPMVFGRKNNRYCFGLSGNPVSSFVQFELYVKPFLYAMMGHEFKPSIIKVPLGSEISRRQADRVNFIPARLNAAFEAVPVAFHGSAHIHALMEATHLMEFPAGVFKLNKGDRIHVRPL